MFKTQSTKNIKYSETIEVLDQLEQLEKLEGVKNLQSVINLRNLEKLSLKPSSSRAIQRKFSRKFSEIAETVKDRFMASNSTNSHEVDPKHDTEPKCSSFMCSPMVEIRDYESTGKNPCDIHFDAEANDQAFGIIPIAQKNLTKKELDALAKIEKLVVRQNKLDFVPNQNNRAIAQRVAIDDENRWPVEKISNRCSESQKVYCLGCNNEVYTDVRGCAKLLLLLIMIILIIPFIFCVCKDFLWTYKHKCSNCKLDCTYYEDNSYFCNTNKN